MEEKSLKSKTLKGVGWSAADSILGQGVTFIVGIVLARLLSPTEYGLIGICIIVNSILDGFVDSGFSSAIIRKKDATNIDYNTMFWTNLSISIGLYIALFFSTSLIATFFERPELTVLIRATGLVVIINALSLTQQTILYKRIDFKTRTKASLISSILSGVVGICMAYSGFGVWALVGQILSQKGLYSICLWCFNKWWPSLCISMDSLRYMWGFGWKLLVGGLLNRIWDEVYQTIVAKFYTPATLGQYTRSKQYAQIFSVNINAIVMRVSYPVLASIQDDKERMVSAYRRIIKMTMLVTSVCMISLGAVADPLIYVLIGPQWHVAATFLPFICVSLSLYPLHAINLNMLKVLGRSDLLLKYEILKKVISIIPICLGIFVDIYWMLCGSIVTGIIAVFINTWYTGKRLGYTSWKQLKDIAPGYSTGLVIALSVYFLKYLPISNFTILPIQIVVGCIVFFTLMEVMKLDEYAELKGIAFKMIRKLKKR